MWQSILNAPKWAGKHQQKSKARQLTQAKSRLQMLHGLRSGHMAVVPCAPGAPSLIIVFPMIAG